MNQARSRRKNKLGKDLAASQNTKDYKNISLKKEKKGQLEKQRKK